MIDHAKHATIPFVADARLAAWDVVLGRRGAPDHSDAIQARRPRRPSFPDLLAAWLTAAVSGTAMGEAAARAYIEAAATAEADSPEPAKKEFARAA